MKAHWLTQKGNRSCIMFFAGWGMDPNPFIPVAPRQHDLLMFYDYRVMKCPSLADLCSDYEELHLLSWSMGVWVAAHLFDGNIDRFGSTVAVNGTLKPVDDRCGISEKAFTSMINTLSDETMNVFYESMFDNPAQAEIFLQNRPRREVDDTKAELVALHDAYQVNGPPQDMYTRKLVGRRDRIFPARSQLRCWGKDESTVVQMSHFPFYGQQGLENLV